MVTMNPNVDFIPRFWSFVLSLDFGAEKAGKVKSRRGDRLLSNSVEGINGCDQFNHWSIKGAFRSVFGRMMDEGSWGKKIGGEWELMKAQLRWGARSDS
jgi:hypothetical protein